MYRHATNIKNKFFASHFLNVNISGTIKLSVLILNISREGTVSDSVYIYIYIYIYNLYIYIKIYIYRYIWLSFHFMHCRNSVEKRHKGSRYLS